ncbi:MAG: NTP transferase domain-containing protein [Sphingomonadales bacterium]
MKVIILSAGRGSRLLPLTENIPKCLLDVNGRCVLDRQVRLLDSRGLGPIKIVTGFQSHLVDQELAAFQAEGIDAQSNFNPFYQVADNLASCWMAREHMDGPFILLNGDTLLSEGALDKVLAREMDCPIVVTTDEAPQYDDDDMKVELKDGRLSAISKDLPAERTHAESIGLLRFRSDGAGLFLETVDRILRTRNGLNLWFLQAIDQIAKSHHVGVISIAGELWGELDDKKDLKYLRSVFN